MTSAPLSILNEVVVSFKLIFEVHGLLEGFFTVSRLIISPKKYVSSSDELSWWAISSTCLLLLYCRFTWRRYALAQCPFLEHLLHIDSLAGHFCLGCSGPRHRVHLALSNLLRYLLSANFSRSRRCLLFLITSSILCTWFPINFSPWMTHCCFLTSSFCLAWAIAFARVNFASSCSFSDNFWFFNPTTMRSLINWSFSTSNHRCPS